MRNSSGVAIWASFDVVSHEHIPTVEHGQRDI